MELLIEFLRIVRSVAVAAAAAAAVLGSCIVICAGILGLVFHLLSRTHAHILALSQHALRTNFYFRVILFLINFCTHTFSSSSVPA